MTQCSGSICGLYPLDVSSTCCSGLSNVFLKDKSILGQEPPAYSYTRKPRFSHSWVSNTVLTSRLLQHPVPTRHFPDRAWSRPGRSSSLLLTAAAAPYAKRVGEALVLHAQKCGRDQGRRDPHGRAVRGPPRITNPNSELRQMLQQQRKLLFLHLFPPLASLLLSGTLFNQPPMPAMEEFTRVRACVPRVDVVGRPVPRVAVLEAGVKPLRVEA